MKVLLVTNQYIDIRNGECYCNFALHGTLENMSVLGDLYIVSNKQLPDKPAAQPLNKKINFISAQHVKHFKPTNRGVFSFLGNYINNRRLLNDLIPDMDLVIWYSPSINSDLALRISHKNHIPFLTFLVGCTWDALHNHHRLLARIMAPISWYTTRKTVKKSEYVHYVTKEFLQRRYPSKGKTLGCSDINLSNINKNILIERLENSSTLNSGRFIKLVTTANIDVRYKGQEYVIRAIAKLKESGDIRYHYYLLGAGKGQYLKELTKKLGIEDQIHFEGRKKPEEVISTLVNSDIYLQPSLQEGLPRAVVEAMSVALPCIGFNTGGMFELLESEFVVPQKSIDEIINCLKKLQNIEKYQKTAEYNFQKSCEYEHSLLTSQIREFFKEIRIEIENEYDSKIN